MVFCDVSLSLLQPVLRISVFSKLVMLTLWDRFHEIPLECCNGRVCRCLAKCFYYTLGTVTGYHLVVSRAEMFNM